jgi:asparagine synthetase B (glutamine-hydrolysing)
VCGIFGIAGNGIIDTDLKILRELAQASVVRGQDGAGIVQGAVYNKYANYTVEKTANEIAYLLWYHEKGKGGDRHLFNSHVDNFFAGHVRAATKGVISADNAHPFDLSKIVGMHNGTLESSDYRPGNNITDSELMFNDINTHGVQPVLSKLNSKSAYAIVIYDKVKRELVFARNEHRPLHCSWNLNRKVLYWASEKEMLEWILNRNFIKRHNVCEFATGLIHRISPLDIHASSKKQPWTLEYVNPPPVEKKQEKVKDFSPSFEIKHGVLVPVQQKPDLRIVPRTELAKPSPLPEQQKAKEKDEKGTEGSKEAGPKERAVMPREALHKDCCGCGKDMDLLEQYLGNEIGTGRYLCKKCDDLFEVGGLRERNFVN